MSDGLIDVITTPAQGNRLPEGVPFIADNGVFGKGFPGEDKWWTWVQTLDRDLCRFVVAPDVVGDAEATLARSRPWLPKIRGAGFKAAFVAQDGLTPDTTPWDEFDALFVGGTTGWKLGPDAREVVAVAKLRGKWVHMGRVNSELRLRYACAIGCDSADGTFLAFGPDVNLRKLLGWVDRSDWPALFPTVSP